MFENQNEIWRPVVGYEGYYSVSNFGRVRSEAREDSLGRTLPESILKARMHRNGYLQVNFCRNGQKKTFKVHRLVALAFLDNPENKEQVNHINNVRDDNRLENLEWCTRSENSQHCSRQGRSRCRFTGYMTADKIQKLYELLDKGLSQRQVASLIGVDQKTVWRYNQKQRLDILIKP